MGHDDGKLLYKSIALNLLQLYFFTGFLANFPGLININNLILVLFVAYVWLSVKRRSSLFSPLIIIYGTMTALSLGNHLWWMSEAGLPQGARTMPIVLFAMLACRMCAVPGMFERGILMNALPFALLIPIGANIEEGRYVSYFLNENINGAVLPFSFAVGACALLEQRYNWKSLTTLFIPLSFMLFSARRSMLFYFVSASAILGLNGFIRNKLRPRKILYAALVLIFLLSVALPVMIERQAGRFGDDFQPVEHISRLISGDVTDKSSLDRKGFIDLAIDSVSDNWLGFGNANFLYVVRSYGPRYLSDAGHPHSGLADSLITGGYPGMILYSLLLLYLLSIGYKSPLMCLCLTWLILSVFFEANLSNRILWPLLAIAEQELQLTGLGRGLQ